MPVEGTADRNIRTLAAETGRPRILISFIARYLKLGRVQRVNGRITHVLSPADQGIIRHALSKLDEGRHEA